MMHLPMKIDIWIINTITRYTDYLEDKLSNEMENITISRAHNP